MFGGGGLSSVCWSQLGLPLRQMSRIFCPLESQTPVETGEPSTRLLLSITDCWRKWRLLRAGRLSEPSQQMFRGRGHLAGAVALIHVMLI